MKIFDRPKLSYLNWFQNIGCVYCGYANGLAPYWLKMAAETEKYWCGVQHKNDPDFIEPGHHKDFAPYGDEQEFKKKYVDWAIRELRWKLDKRREGC